MTIRWVVFLLMLLAFAFVPLSYESNAVRVASKKFTESVVLGEIAAHLAKSENVKAVHQAELGGTQLVFQALLAGDIDLYPEYTGTIRQEILAGQELEKGTAVLQEAMADRGILMTKPLGFNNTYAIGMREADAEKFGITTISDLTRHSTFKFRFSNEFMDRHDGWPGLRKEYALPQENVKGIDHDLAYRQIEAGQVEAIDVYTTDAKISMYNLRVLEDDLGYFPKYEAVFLIRKELLQTHPKLVESIQRMEGTIDANNMRLLNRHVELEHLPETRVAADFLSEKFSIETNVKEETTTSRIVKHTIEHLDLVRRSLVVAILFAIPLGIFAAKKPRVGQVILGVVGIIQTIPALALLVVLIRPVGLLGLSSTGPGSTTAIIALFLYSLLPIVRNTYTALHEIAPTIQESAAALGLPWRARLWFIELPLASRTILAGIKTAAVINIGFATLGALIGAGGYGQPILTGIRLNDTSLILQGAVPAAVLALLVQGLFELAERFFVPKGLRLKSEA